MSYWITTTDPNRARRWEHIFGSDRLPVLSPATRWDMVEGQERPCYDLALGQLSTWQRDRLAAYAARRTGRPYGTVRAEIEAAISWPVSAAGCHVVTEEETAERTRPSLFIPILRHKRQIGWGGNGLRVAKLRGRLAEITGMKNFRFFRFLP